MMSALKKSHDTPVTRLHRNETQNIGVGTLRITDLIHNLLSLFGNCRLENGLVCHFLVGPGRRLNPYPGHRLPQDCWLYGDPSPRTHGSFPLFMPVERGHIWTTLQT